MLGSLYSGDTNQGDGNMAQAIKQFNVACYWLSPDRTVPVDTAFFLRMKHDAMSIIFFGEA